MRCPFSRMALISSAENSMPTWLRTEPILAATALRLGTFSIRRAALRRGFARRDDDLIRQAGSDSMFEFFTADRPGKWGDSIYVQALLA